MLVPPGIRRCGYCSKRGEGIYLRAGRSRSSRPASRGADARVRMPIAVKGAVEEIALLMISLSLTESAGLCKCQPLPMA